MVDSYMYISTKIGINSFDGFWENEFYERTDDGRPRHGISSAKTQSNRAKNTQSRLN